VRAAGDQGREFLRPSCRSSSIRQPHNRPRTSCTCHSHSCLPNSADDVQTTEPWMGRHRGAGSTSDWPAPAVPARGSQALHRNRFWPVQLNSLSAQFLPFPQHSVPPTVSSRVHSVPSVHSVYSMHPVPSVSPVPTVPSGQFSPLSRASSGQLLPHQPALKLGPLTSSNQQGTFCINPTVHCCPQGWSLSSSKISKPKCLPGSRNRTGPRLDDNASTRANRSWGSRWTCRFCFMCPSWTDFGTTGMPR
jgi:hypothetical protein